MFQQKDSAVVYIPYGASVTCILSYSHFVGKAVLMALLEASLSDLFGLLLFFP